MQLPNGTVAYRKVCSRSQDWLIQTKQCTSKTSPRFDATSTVAFDLSKKEQCDATNQYCSLATSESYLRDDLDVSVLGRDVASLI